MIIQTIMNTTGTVPELHGGTPDNSRSPTADTPSSQRPSQQPTRQQVEAAVEAVNRALKPSSQSLQFSVDKQSDRIVVKVVDGETGETVRQVPSEEVLAIADSIGHYQKGLILSQEA